MSDNVMSSGFMAVLKTPFDSDNGDREEKDEWLYDQDSGLHLNYEGTMVYSDERSDGYGLTIHTGEAPVGGLRFSQTCSKYGLEIDPSTIRCYSCYWYNGVDSDMAMLTLAKYLEKIAD